MTVCGGTDNAAPSDVGFWSQLELISPTSSTKAPSERPRTDTEVTAKDIDDYKDTKLAEELKFGADMITSGAVADIEEATRIARQLRMTSCGQANSGFSGNSPASQSAGK